MQRRFSPYFPSLFLLIDLLVLNASFVAANYFRFEIYWYEKDNYPMLCLFLNTSWIWIYYLNKLFRVDRETSLIEGLNKILFSVTAQLALVFTAWFALKSYYYSREHLFYTFFLFTFFLLSWRFILILVLRYFRARGYNFRNVVMLGYNEVARYLEDYIEVNPQLGYNFVGYFVQEEVGFQRKVLGTIEDFPAYAGDNSIDIVYCSLPNLKSNQIRDAIDFSENNLIQFNILSDFSYFNSKNLVLEKHGDISAINLSSVPLDLKVNQISKRVFDLIFSLSVIILILSWLTPLIALLIKLESRGPILFRQQRTGKSGVPFECFKFRSMTVNLSADERQATKNDNRITKIGAFIRKTSIDELPQFFNVLLGDMSVVGPRPHMIAHTNEYSKKVDRFMVRHYVKPGITGLAQAKGFRGETKYLSEMKWRVKLDRFYVKNWSLVLDLKIIILTVVSLIKGDENAY